ncbi:hypothetical protein QQ44_06345 [Mycolicibacterium setense]|uniref:TetR family transcriptional regulator n=2 Tax=Mycolicibacterium setense TaxID=431269 RepID=A0ABR4YYZ4_9MYCO|nr:hypothetical protein QQ44_06345 [Mycolicibacterium setense]
MQLLQRELNDTIVGMIKIKGDPALSDFAAGLGPSLEGSFRRVSEAKSIYTVQKLADMGEKHFELLNGSLATEDWVKVIPGRQVLRKFVSDHVPGIAYEPFVNLVLDRMVESSVEPAGMKMVLDYVLAAP